MAGAGLHADLAEPGQAVAQLGEFLLVAFDVGVQLFRRGVLLADFADLAAEADRHAVGLQVTNELGDLGRAHVVVILLLVEGFRLQRDQGAGVDVDVPEAGGNGLGDEVLDFLDGAFGVLGVGGRLDLEVIALDEDGTAVAFLDGGGDQRGAVFGGRLIRVAHFAAGDFEDEGGRVGLHGGAEGGACRVIRREADVHGGHGAVFPGVRRTRHVEVIDACRTRIQRLPQLPDQPAGVVLDGVGAEDRVAHEDVDIRRRAGPPGRQPLPCRRRRARCR